MVRSRRETELRIPKQRRNQLTEPRTSKTLLAVRNPLFRAARWLPDTTPSSPSLHKVRPAQIENWPWTRGADAGWQDHFRSIAGILLARCC